MRLNCGGTGAMFRYGTTLTLLAGLFAGAAHAQAPTQAPIFGIPTAEQIVVAPPLPVPAEIAATAPETPPTQPAAPTEAEKAAAEKAAAAKAGEAIEKLSAAVEKISKNLTVVTGDEEMKLVLGGVISADFFYNHARPVSAGIPFFLTPRSPFGFNQDTFDANARQTQLFAAVVGPKFCDFDTGGLIAVCLFNDALIVDRYGILPIQAYGEMKNKDWRFAAGLQFDIFNPLNPTTLDFDFLGASGNAGASFPGQLRVERFLYPDDESQITLTFGLSEPLSTTLNNSFRLNEDNGWPNIEGRAAWALGALQGEGPTAKRPFEVGFSGLIGQLRSTQADTRVVANVWGLGTDLRWAITPRFGFQGEAFVGQSLGEYTANILQSTNAITFQGVHDSGGWVEAYYYICPDTLHVHAGYGIDDPLDGDLNPGSPVRNETYFTNLIWDPTKHIRVGVQANYRRTEYTLVRNNDGFGGQMQFQLKF
jgi:hypothetical protein